MKIRMKATLSGLRNGVSWPGRGETIVVPDDEGASLCAAGVAEPVAAVKHDRVEFATVPDDAEQRTALTTQSAQAVMPSSPNEGVKQATPRKAPVKKPAAKKAAPAKPQADSK